MESLTRYLDDQVLTSALEPRFVRRTWRSHSAEDYAAIIELEDEITRVRCRLARDWRDCSVDVLTAAAAGFPQRDEVCGVVLHAADGGGQPPGAR